MRRIGHRYAWAVSAWVLAAALVAAEDPAGRGGRRPALGSARDRTRHDAPEWVAPPIEVAPPWVGDGFPSKDRELRLTAPRVKVLSIEAVPEPSAWEPAADRAAR